MEEGSETVGCNENNMYVKKYNFTKIEDMVLENCKEKIIYDRSYNAYRTIVHVGICRHCEFCAAGKYL